MLYLAALATLALACYWRYREAAELAAYVPVPIRK